MWLQLHSKWVKFDVVSVYTLLSAGFKKPGFFQKSPTHRVLLGFFGF